MGHGRNRNQNTGQQASDVAAKDASQQTAFEAQIDGIVRRIQYPRRDTHCKNAGKPQREFYALIQRAHLAHQHPLHRIRPHQNTGERGYNAQLDQQRDQMPFHSRTIIIEANRHQSQNMQSPAAFRLQKVAEADFPTEYGAFRIFGFAGHYPDRLEEAVVLRMGDLHAGATPPLVRIHSECLTGDVFHSLRCDCRAQLELALTKIAEESRGLLIYEHQEGRGIGLLNKLRAYELQDRGADTVEANEQLGFQVDLRSYELPAEILRFFDLKKIRLLSNNPQKVEAVERAGIRVTERVPCVIPALDSTESYLRTKKTKMGHLFEGL